VKVAIIGCGLIGLKRSQNLGGLALAAACDSFLEKAQALADQHPGCQAFDDWRPALALADVGIVVVATTHDQLAHIALEAVKAGKHVLIEKPGARSRAELEPVVALAEKGRTLVKIGFNHRFHPSLLKAREILAAGQAGPMMFVRARYGHGGRVGYDKEWRAIKEISGGGELIDQGMHLIDLSRMFLGDFSGVSGYLPTYFWKMPVEDNAFMLLKTASGQAAWLHASWTEWKNLFSFEIYARHAKLHAEGLGGSYGPEKLTHYQMTPEMGPPQATVYEFPGPDLSWSLEFADFLNAIKSGARPQGDGRDGLAALAIVDQLNKP
jgi:predicted dehydrogenase